MKNLTKQDVRKVAQKYGATLTNTEYDPYDQSYEFMIDAPEGYEWTNVAGGLLVVWWAYDRNSKQESFLDAIQRMEQTGISKNTGIMKTVEIPANVKSRIQRWINDLDGRSHYNNTFRYGDYEILAEVEVDECFDYINVDVWVFLNGDEVPFEGLSTTELEDNYIEVLYYSREQGQAMKDTYNSLR